MSKAYVFLDSNIFLHFRPFDQVDWLPIARAREVELVIAPIVVRELDHHKDQHRNSGIRDRARKALKKIEDLELGSGETELAEGVTLHYANEPRLAYKDYGLVRESNDDQLIACCIEAKGKYPDDSVLLITDDTGPRLKASRNSIKAATLPEGLRLPSSVAESEKTILELRKKVQELKSSLPELRLQFHNGQENYRFSLDEPKHLTKEEIEAKIVQLRAEYPVYDRLPDPDPPAHTSLGLARSESHLRAIQQQASPEAYGRYNTQVMKYYDQFREYLERVNTYEEINARTVILTISLFNQGTAPALDIDVNMHLPDGFELFDDRTVPAALVRPQPPTEPDPLGSMPSIGSFIPDSLFAGSSGVGSLVPPNISSPTISRGNSYNVCYQVGKLKQHMNAPCRELLAVFDTREAVSSFGIDYRINSASLPHEVSGRLNVVVDAT